MLRELLNNDAFCEKYDIGHGVKGKKIIVQGFGNVGYYFSKFATKEGARVVAIVERDVAIYNAGGFDPDDVKMHMQKTGTLKGYD